LLGERGEKEPWLDALILVSAPELVRVQRLVQGRDTPEDVAWQRVRAQSDPERKRAYSTWVVDNGGSREQLLTQVDAIAEELLGNRGTG
jgi:dephospho-CoA kinase